MLAAVVITEAERRGLRLIIRDDGGLRVLGDPSEIETLSDEIRANRNQLIEIVRRRSVIAGNKVNLANGLRPGGRGVMCARCHKIDRCFGDAKNGYACPACAEWRVSGCPGFTTLSTCNDAAEMDFGECMRCGATWALHGKPHAASWTRVADLDGVQPAAVAFVLARAREIAKEARQ
jgi:hypothetical protein